MWIIVCLLLFDLLQDSLGGTITRNITLNGRLHTIMGTSLNINGIGVDYFANIPYAKPPINDLRFKPPENIFGDFWTGVYNSTSQPNTCWQASGGDFDILNLGAKLWLSKTTMSEDCLYLTIWVPSGVTSSLPVMVWIYGGGFNSGSSTLEVYDGSILASKQNVVVVSLQYRLGPLGFLYLDETFAPGNQGLLDQRMALQWVKSNINNFNGDQQKITIFGESAGSVSVSFHVLSSLSQGLFQRAIMESGTVLCPWAIDTKNEARVKAIELISYLNCTPKPSDTKSLLSCVQKADPSNLSNLQFNLVSLDTKQRKKILQKRGVTYFYSDVAYFLQIAFKPVYDKLFIPDKRNLQLSALFLRSDIELLMGFNANEGMYFLLYGLNSTLNFLSNQGTIMQTNRLASNSSNSVLLPNMILENLLNQAHAYKSLIPLFMYEYEIPSTILGSQQWDDLQVLAPLDQLTGDYLFVCPVVTLASIIAKRSRNIYMYRFDHKTSSLPFPPWVGSMHGYEIEYIFGMPFSDVYKNLYYKFSAEEETLSNGMMTFWANFAKFGNPTPTPVQFFGNNVSWPPYNGSSSAVVFDLLTSQESSEPPVQVNAKNIKCKFWTEVLPAIVNLSVRGPVSSTESRLATRLWILFAWMPLVTFKLLS